MEVQLDILEIAAFWEDGVMLVIDDSRYTQQVPMAIGTLQIDTALDLETDEEIEKLSVEWKRGSLSTLLTLKSAQLVDAKTQEFDLDRVRADVKLTKTITLKPFESTHIGGLLKGKGNYI